MVTLKAHILPHHDLQPPGCRGSDEAWAFRSRASRSAKWITGPLENESESWEDQSVYSHSS
ncbi:hypothetical protein E4X73_12925 [Salmonella enterica]|nr:hypothetical protein [Salmonella enterica]